MSAATIIAGARVLDPSTGTDAVLDVVVQDGTIVSVGPHRDMPAGSRWVDARGLVLSPGFVDLHVHLREPGDEHKETIETGAHAAAAGGFTTIIAMPNTKPVLDNAALVRFVRERSAAAGYARVLPSAAISLGQKGETITEMAELAEAGAACFTDDGRPVASAGLMRRALEYATLVQKPVMVHEEEPTLSGGCMHEGLVSTRLGLRGIPGAAEDVMVHRDLVLAQLTGGHLHVAHISTAESVRAVREAKARGIHVTCEATPHHFTLTDDGVGDYDTHAKMAPPLRPASDRDAIIEGLKDGTIDAIATDHAPHATTDKEVEFDQAANGVTGLETAFGLTLRLVTAGHLTLPQAVALLSTRPAKIFGLDAGTLAPGSRADFVLFDPDATTRVDASKSFSKSRNTPFDGWELPGKVVATWVAGREVYRATA